MDRHRPARNQAAKLKPAPANDRVRGPRLAHKQRCRFRWKQQGDNDGPTDKEIVRSIVGIAHTLGEEAIAEGVENAGALKTLQRLGVDYAQGYHLGRPAALR